jgi:hypothetical protein
LPSVSQLDTSADIVGFQAMKLSSKTLIAALFASGATGFSGIQLKKNVGHSFAIRQVNS